MPGPTRIRCRSASPSDEEEERNSRLWATFDIERFAKCVENNLTNSLFELETLISRPDVAAVTNEYDEIEDSAKDQDFFNATGLVSAVCNYPIGPFGGSLAPFFECGTLPEGLTLRPAVPVSAAVSLAVFRTSFHIFRRLFGHLLSENAAGWGPLLMSTYIDRLADVTNVLGDS